MASIFISYSKDDTYIVNHIAKELELGGHQVWYDKDLLPGMPFQEKVLEVMKNSDAIILVITDISVKSLLVNREVERAIQFALESDKLVIPLVEGNPDKMPASLKNKQYISLDRPDCFNDILKAIDNHMKDKANRETKIEHIGNSIDDYNGRPKIEIIKRLLKEKGYYSGIVDQEISIELSEALQRFEEASSGSINSIIQLGDPVTLDNLIYELSEFNVSPPKSVNNWLLKINPKTWEIETFHEGYKARFHTHDLNNNRRREYDLFHQLVIGDKIIGYAFGHYNSIVCTFKVSSGVYTDEKLGEGIDLEITSIVRPPISVTEFGKYIPFANELSDSSPLRLFSMDQTLYREILGRIELPVEWYHPRAAIMGSTLLTEGNHKQTEDQLEFSYDIESFATVISLASLKPPLAIGLFGNWGSGKSFFMEKLESAIDGLADSGNDKYVKHVVQVKFNSWHYSDSNLWASLITEIFESLRNSKHKNAGIEQVFDSLQIARLNKGKAESERRELLVEIDRNKVIYEKQKEELRHISMLDVLKRMLLNKHVGDDLGMLQNSSTESIGRDIKRLDGYIKEAESATGVIKGYFSEFLCLKGRWWWAVGAAALIYVLGLWGKYGGQEIWSHFTDGFAKWFAFASLFAGNIVSAIRPYVQTAEKMLERLKSLKTTLEKRSTKSENELQGMESKMNLLVEGLQEIDKEISTLEQQASDAATGRRLYSFLEKKTGEESYAKQTGLLSWIRKDFAMLDNLLREQAKARAVAGHDQETFMRIDRIVLYIDDLDRCSHETVLKVLEAVHLLLAFELFVVVVGVDPRWLDKAIEKKYGDMLSKTTAKPVTSYDYLEKIFQVPFAIKPVSVDGQKQLIKYLVKDEMEVVLSSEVPTAAGEPPVDTTQPPLEEFPLWDNNQILDNNKLKESDVADTQKKTAQKTLETIKFTEEELMFLQDISILFGNTPRVINRYVNMYRVIKAHRSFSLQEHRYMQDCKSAMLALAVLVGMPDEFSLYASEIKAKPDMVMNELIMVMDHKKLKDFLQQIGPGVYEGMDTSLPARNLALIERFSFHTLIKA